MMEIQGGEYSTEGLPTKKGDLVENFSKIQQIINDFRKNTKNKYKDNKNVKQIRKYLKNISQNLPTLYAQFMNNAEQMQQQNTKGNDMSTTGISENLKKAYTAISKAHLYNKNVREAIYMENFKNIELYKELETNINELPEDFEKLPNFGNINFDGLKNEKNNSEGYKGAVSLFKENVDTVIKNLNPGNNNLQQKMLKTSFEALKANLEQDLKYIEKHCNYIKAIKELVETAKEFNKNCKNNYFEKAKESLNDIVSVLDKPQRKYINKLDNLINIWDNIVHSKQTIPITLDSGGIHQGSSDQTSAKDCIKIVLCNFSNFNKNFKDTVCTYEYIRNIYNPIWDGCDYWNENTAIYFASKSKLTDNLVK